MVQANGNDTIDVIGSIVDSTTTAVKALTTSPVVVLLLPSPGL